MEKKEIKVNYSGSGVKTLNGFGTLFLVIGCIAALVVIIGLIVYASNVNKLFGDEDAAAGLAICTSALPFVIVSFIGGAICLGLSSIAKAALYQRLLLEEENNFVIPSQPPLRYIE